MALLNQGITPEMLARILQLLLSQAKKKPSLQEFLRSPQRPNTILPPRQDIPPKPQRDRARGLRQT